MAQGGAYNLICILSSICKEKKNSHNFWGTVPQSFWGYLRGWCSWSHLHIIVDVQRKKILRNSEDLFLRSSEEPFLRTSQEPLLKSSWSHLHIIVDVPRKKILKLWGPVPQKLWGTGPQNYLKALDLICILSSMCKEKKSSETLRTHSSEALRTVPQSFWGTGPQNFSRTIT